MAKLLDMNPPITSANIKMRHNKQPISSCRLALVTARDRPVCVCAGWQCAGQWWSLSPLFPLWVKMTECDDSDSIRFLWFTSDNTSPLLMTEIPLWLWWVDRHWSLLLLEQLAHRQKSWSPSRSWLSYSSSKPSFELSRISSSSSPSNTELISVLLEFRLHGSFRFMVYSCWTYTDDIAQITSDQRTTLIDTNLVSM